MRQRRRGHDLGRSAVNLHDADATERHEAESRLGDRVRQGRFAEDMLSCGDCIQDDLLVQVCRGCDKDTLDPGIV